MENADTEKWGPWIEFRGEECPVSDDEFVHVEFRIGRKKFGLAENFSWEAHFPQVDLDIVRYRRLLSNIDKYNGAMKKSDSTSALTTQVAGTHYCKLKIQPVEYIHANNIPFAEGNVIRYITRWRDKGGIQDLEKAKHMIEILIELERKNANL